MKLGNLKDFSSSKDVCISKDKKVLLHKQAIFSTFSDKMAADSLHFVIYCFTPQFIFSEMSGNLKCGAQAWAPRISNRETWSLFYTTRFVKDFFQIR